MIRGDCGKSGGAWGGSSSPAALSNLRLARLPHAAVVFAAGVGFFGSAGDVGPVVDFDG